jgi:hypothetical protein
VRDVKHCIGCVIAVTLLPDFPIERVVGVVMHLDAKGVCHDLAERLQLVAVTERLREAGIAIGRAPPDNAALTKE